MKKQVPSPALSSVMRMLLDRQRSFLAEGVAATFGRVNERFFDIADSSPDTALQTAYFDAMKILRAERKQVQQRVVDQLEETYTALLSKAAQLITPSSDFIQTPLLETDEDRSGEVVDLNNLSLVEKDELEAIILIDTMVSKARVNVLGVLRTLTGRVTTVLGYAPEGKSQPFEPEYLVSCFDSRSRHIDIGLQPRLSLLSLFEEAVLDNLPGFLEECDALLESMNIKPTFIEHTSADESDQADDQEEDSTGKDIESLGTGLMETERGRDIVDRASRRLLAEMPETIAEQLAQQSPEREYPQLNVAVTKLLDLGEGEAVNTEFLGIRQQIDAELAQQETRFDELHPLDQCLINLMEVLFDQRNLCGWLPDTLSDLSGKISLPTLNLAAVDPGFFDREYHPARRVLNEIATLASGLQGDDSPASENLHQKLNEVADKLRVIRSDLNGLTDLMAELIQFSEKERVKEDILAGRTMEEAIARERTNKAYEQIEKVLGERLCGVRRPLFLVDFAEQAWCKVLFFAHVKHGVDSLQWQTALHLLDQLVGLTEDPDSADQTYFRRLKEALADSLELIAFNSFESSRLLARLDHFFTARPSEAPFHVLEKEEAREAGQYGSPVVADSLDLSIPGEPPLREDDLLAQLDDADLSRVDSIATNTWVEFSNISGESVRGRLLGVVPATSRFVFGDKSGKKVAEADRYRLAVAMKEGNLVVLDNSHLFDKAMQEAFEVIRKKAANET